MKNLLGDIYCHSIKTVQTDGKEYFSYKLYFLIRDNFFYFFDITDYNITNANELTIDFIGNANMNRFINNLRNGYKYKLIPLVENSESIIPYKFKLIIKNTKRKKDKPPKEKDTPEEIIKNFREHRKKYKRLLKKFKNFKKEQENKFTEYKEYKIIEGMDVKGFVDEKLKALDILRCNKIKRNEDLTFVDGVIEGLNKIKKYISILQVEKEDKNPMLTVTTGEPPIIRSQFKFGNGTWRNINENK